MTRTSASPTTTNPATTSLPPRSEMLSAVAARDRSYDGVFFIAVRTTGIFCRPGCPARQPKPENVGFYPSVQAALLDGYRPCKRCRPLQPDGTPPAWLAPLLDDVEADPARRWTDADLRARDLDPGRVRRWFGAHHGMTFHAYQRARRLGKALGRLRHGDDLTATALDHGFDSLSGFREAFGKLFGTPPGKARARTVVTVTRLTSPLGPLIAAADDDGVCLLEFADRRMLPTQIERLGKRLGCTYVPGDHPHLDRLSDELTAWFAGGLTAFGVPITLPGTDFQRAVWQQLLAIPHGETRSYEQLARALGRPGAQRAVGRANGDNRLAILVPCHRVVRSDGSLCGYGGGLWRKRWLLDHERSARPRLA